MAIMATTKQRNSWYVIYLFVQTKEFFEYPNHVVFFSALLTFVLFPASQGQKFVVDCEMYVPLADAGRSDELARTVQPTCLPFFHALHLACLSLPASLLVLLACPLACFPISSL